MEKRELKAIIEALLCLSSEPISMEQMFKVIDEAEEKIINEALNELIADYNGDNRGVSIMEVAGGYQIVTRPQYDRWIR
ncbi:MAG: SMC-Scp complex subunit ScpB, partial [Candidatus Aminicenantes bacterium]|nr:SMC-Scp complex subunit ScpB [Candidatus Aminicenantes bacterium]